MSRDDLVFIQTEPLTTHRHRPSSGFPSVAGGNDGTAHILGKPISSGPLPPPPRRQASLKHAIDSKTIGEVPSSSAPGKRDDEVTSTRSTDPRRAGHVKSKSAGANPSLPASTPLLNPFRTARSDVSNGLVPPPPVPPKPIKVVASQKVNPIAAPLITIDHDASPSHTESNPFRRRSMQEHAASPVKVARQAAPSSKPPLPPRQPASQYSGRASSQVSHGNSSERAHAPYRLAPVINNIQPTSLLKPSRLIQEGLDAAEKARSSGRSSSPNNIITLSNSQQRPTTLSAGFRSFGIGDSGSERSSRRDQKKVVTANTRRRRERSSTLTSITTDGTTSSDSSFTGTDHEFASPHANQQAPLQRHAAEHSPFADPCLLDTSLPPPPNRNVSAQLDGIARVPRSIDIIATSAEEGHNGFAHARPAGSRRFTLSSSDAHPVTDQGSSLLSDLGDDVRRAAEEVGKDLEWLRGGRGGRTLGMTLAAQEDQAGREGLMQDTKKDHTGSPAISNDRPMKV